ncbi:MAG: hypothetical protein HW410_1625 [Nitrosarchaeum sp.]|nr:hypothetical protein [Nitrosarchaeum sp.]
MNGKFVIVAIILLFVGLTISLAIMQQLEIQKQNEAQKPITIKRDPPKAISQITPEKEVPLATSTQNKSSYVENSVQIKPEKKITVTPEQYCKGNKICDTEIVTKIVDGDTLYSESYRIRLSLTNTPEKNNAGFTEATDFTRFLCPVGSMILIDQDDLQPYDKFDRLLGKVTCSGKVLNSELLYNNHANILKQFCKTSEFSDEPWAKKFGCN